MIPVLALTDKPSVDEIANLGNGRNATDDLEARSFHPNRAIRSSTTGDNGVTADTELVKRRSRENPSGVGRVCRGVELDPLYVDVIIRPYEEATGNPAVLVETGETFELLALRRTSEATPV
jgi:hypothetical protein